LAELIFILALFKPILFYVEPTTVAQQASAHCKVIMVR